MLKQQVTCFASVKPGSNPSPVKKKKKKEIRSYSSLREVEMHGAEASRWQRGSHSGESTAKVLVHTAERFPICKCCVLPQCKSEPILANAPLAECIQCHFAALKNQSRLLFTYILVCNKIQYEVERKRGAESVFSMLFYLCLHVHVLIYDEVLPGFPTSMCLLQDTFEELSFLGSGEPSCSLLLLGSESGENQCDSYGELKSSDNFSILHSFQQNDQTLGSDQPQQVLVMGWRVVVIFSHIPPFSFYSPPPSSFPFCTPARPHLVASQGMTPPVTKGKPK